MELTETLISSSPVVHNSFLRIDRDQIRLPNGNEHARIVVRHPGAACILAVTDDDKVVLVRQWRHAAGRALLEIPAGKLDAGEDPAQCALRELGEETPYTAERVEKIFAFYSAPGFCDEILHLYRAVNITPTSSLHPDQPKQSVFRLPEPRTPIGSHYVSNHTICAASNVPKTAGAAKRQPAAGRRSCTNPAAKSRNS